MRYAIRRFVPQHGNHRDYNCGIRRYSVAYAITITVAITAITITITIAITAITIAITAITVAVAITAITIAYTVAITITAITITAITFTVALSDTFSTTVTLSKRLLDGHVR